MSEAKAALDAVLRRDWGRLLSALIKRVGDFQAAEDALQEAATAALSAWEQALPDRPALWLLKAAERRVIDGYRRAGTAARHAPDLGYQLQMEQSAMDEQYDIPDERLRLIFTACHPALDSKSRVALTLRTLCGLKTPEIARAFLDNDTAMGQRLTRAKAKIRKAGIAYQVPGPEDWGDRLASVLTVIYLIFNAGYGVRSEGDGRDLCREALFLAEMLDALRPDDPEIEGLRAMMILIHARRQARFDRTGGMMPLSEQDRTLWQRDEIAKGQTLLRRALMRGDVGLFQLQAAIQAVHSDAAEDAVTDWDEIIALYNHMAILSNNPVILLNRAVAESYRTGAEAGLAALKPLAARLDAYQPFHAAQADMLRRAGKDASDAYDRALALTERPAERTFLAVRKVQAKKEAEQCSAQVQQGG